MGSEKAKNVVLKALRVAHDYNIKQVAMLSGCGDWTVYSTENGNRKVSNKALEKITKIYNLDIVQVAGLINYYDSLNCDESKKYQLILLRTLNVLLKNSK